MNVWNLLIPVVLAFESAFTSYIPSQPTKSFAAIIPPIPTSTPTIVKPKPNKHYTIALLGDSMIDTLGKDAPDLKSALTTFFPTTTFTIHNFGVGATTIENGIERIPTIVAKHPNIVIVESFAYNPTPNYEDLLTRLFQSIHTQLPNAYMVFAVTIAPNSAVFADGAPGLVFTNEEKLSRTQTIQSYLKTAIRVAKSQKIPLADAYTPSLLPSGEGNPIYISSKDHIHYSPLGRMLLTQRIIETLASSKLSLLQ